MFSKFNCNGNRALRACGFVYCHGGKLMNRIIAGVLIMLSPCAALAQEASTAADQVPIEEYVPKVIIEGKWGTGPGEFGMASQFPLGHFENYEPSSLAVDSKGNIYILDFVNDRIQKFDKSGKYLTELPVEGMKGELAGYCYDGTCYEEPPAPGQKIERKVMGQVEVQGINIVIDSKDTLYYYLKRNKDGKETGEVWEFRNDKLSAKKQKGEETPFNAYEFRGRDKKNLKFAVKKPGDKTLELNLSARRTLAPDETIGMRSRPKVGAKHIVVPVSIARYREHPDGRKTAQQIVEDLVYIYDLNGKLEVILKGYRGLTDGEGNGYKLTVDNNGVLVTKFERAGEK